MRILVCVKRVLQVGGKVVLTEDGLAVDDRFLGATISPHEECAVEEAVQIVERVGGSITVATVGPAAAEEQLRSALSLGATDAVHFVVPPPERTGRELGPQAVARHLADHVLERAGAGEGYDLVLTGNEAADSGDYQVPQRLARRAGLPCATGVKRIELGERSLRAGRERGGAMEVLELPLPAVVAVREGINLPRYPSLPGRVRARSKPLVRVAIPWEPDGLVTRRLRLPADDGRKAEVLGHGREAAPRIVALLDELKVLP